MLCLPESFTLPYPTLATLFDPLPPLRRATAASVRRALSSSVRVATAPKSPTPLLSSSASSPHPLLFASSCRRLHLLVIVWSASSINQGFSTDYWFFTDVIKHPGMPLPSLRTELPRSTLNTQQYSPNSTSLQNSSLSDSDSAKPFPFLQMSAGGAFGGNRGLRPVPPEKGIFPLDHMHLCDLEKKEYLGCLKTAGHQSEKCRDFSKKYLQCRMEKNLMAKQDLAELGFKERNGETPEGKPTERIDN
ncbi:hypothetical protein HN51_053539 [Arachis hypogaea]|uniref:Cytochrome c oxidase assembly protein n=3 Tax=Arachis TaxID=3817 RepID=A0A6B9V611_ARAHY|nr:Cytochrome c oxidase assembly protein [Arachis hypogaea]